MSDPNGTIWRSVDRLLASAQVEGIRAHKLGPLAARRLRRLGEPVPPALAHDERAAIAAMLMAAPLLERIRASCDGPLVLIKGPEVARLYPGAARSFSDLDLLVPDPAVVQKALKEAGFVEVDDPVLFVDHHHLRPLRWPRLGIKVEIHKSVPWPGGREPPSVAGIVEAAAPSQLGPEGVLAPSAVQHTLILAAHAWVHEPLLALRDLVDVAAVAGGVSEAELEQAADAWGLARVWRTTRRAVDGLLRDGSGTIALRLWGRHLRDVRERNVLDNHLQRWLHGFWELPLWAAVAATTDILQQELLPEPGEPWHAKLARATHALRHPLAPVSAHTSSWRAAARRRQRRVPGTDNGARPDDDY